jgi:hypothetical protein
MTIALYDQANINSREVLTDVVQFIPLTGPKRRQVADKKPVVRPF